MPSSVDNEFFWAFEYLAVVFLNDEESLDPLVIEVGEAFASDWSNVTILTSRTSLISVLNQPSITDS
ncbi:MAG: hypothetical protein IPM21_00010 [Acidobacteria bacterium]|nr:hypothetical protein [Acidobacteriota bacterium]